MMLFRALFYGIWCGLIIGLIEPGILSAYQKPHHQELPNFDKRNQKAAKLPPGKAHGVPDLLKDRVPGIRADRHPYFNRASYVRTLDGFLTGHRGRGRGMPPGPKAAQGNGRQRQHEPIKAFLDEYPTLFGIQGKDLQSAVIKRNFVTSHNGMRTVVWQQRYQDVDVYQGVFVGHTTRHDELIGLASGFVPHPGRAAGWSRPQPTVPIKQAVVLAAHSIGETTLNSDSIIPSDAPPAGAENGQTLKAALLPGPIDARLVWLPWSDAELRLCWEIELFRREGGELYRVLVDAHSREVLIRHCRTMYLTDAVYRVFTSDSPTPFSPAHSEPSTNQPPIVEQEIVVLSALSTNASPTGWIHDGENETLGNNVEAHLDRNADNLPDLPRPQGSPFRVFDFPVDLSQDPIQYQQASAVQLFYWCNWMHDQLYELGFTEAAGNFQKDNFGRGGAGEDPIIADAQDGSGFNNANYTPRRDGISPRIQMFLFDGPEPDRDGSLDADIVLHEYTHGLTDRLVGGGAGLVALQSTGMGEGWSDFYAMAFLSEEGDDIHGNYVEGGFSTWRWRGLRENYYYGIRRYPYTTDMTKNPLTFKDADPAQISPYPEVPRSPNHPFNPDTAARVHRLGEIWCVALWEIRANLIERHGFHPGNWLTLQLVTDGLKLSPANPNFLQARDAILLADRILTGGDNQLELWAGFAKRGMGVSASSPSSVTTSGVREAFDLPDLLSIRPLTIPAFAGPVGGPLVPDCRSLTLTNPGDGPIEFSISRSQVWADVLPESGEIPPKGSVTINACLNANALSLQSGIHLSVLTITNVTTGIVQNRTLEVNLFESASLPFVEDFESGFLKNYWVSQGTGFPRTQVTTNNQPLSGQYHLTMDTSRDNFRARNDLTLGIDAEGFTNLVLRFRARSFRDDPDPPPSSSFEEGADFDGVAVSDDGFTWYVVYDFANVSSTFTEVEIPLDPVIQENGLVLDEAFRIRFQQVDNNVIPLDGIALDDVSLTGLAARRFVVSIPAEVGEGDGLLEEAGRVSLPLPLSFPVDITLSSSEPERLGVPPMITILAGQTNAVFDLEIFDDALLEGSLSVQVTASAPGFIADGSQINITDNEKAQIILSIPSLAREGMGELDEEGLLFLDRAPNSDLIVQLTSSDTTEIRVPESLLIQAGETIVLFDVVVVDDREIDGSQTVLVEASGPNFIPDTDVVTVEDNESPRLFLNGPSLVEEETMTLFNQGLLTLGGTLPTNLTVRLTSSDPGLLRVPDFLDIPAGSLSTNFSIQLFEDNLTTGPVNVFVTAQVAGFDPGGMAIRILDDDQAPFAYGPQPANGSLHQPVDLTLSWKTGFSELIVNGGFETGSLAGWGTVPSPSGSFVINDGTIDPLGPGEPSSPFSGSFSALSQQVGPGEQLIYQDVNLPQFVDRLELNWVHRIRNHAPLFGDDQSFRVEIRNAANGLLATAFSTSSGDPLLDDWKEQTFDLTPWRGQFIRLAFVQQDNSGFLNVQVDDVRIFIDDQKPTVSEIYFGTNPDVGDAQFLGLTDESQWTLHPLQIETTYYWRIVTRRAGERIFGPIWSFTTRGVGNVDYFVFDTIEGEILVNQPFPVRITAHDDLGQVVSNYFGQVELAASQQETTDPVQILTFTGFANAFTKYRPTIGAIASHFTNFVETTTTAVEPTALQSQLSGKDVFLVMEQQFSPSGKMEELGDAWGNVLDQFVRSGGTVIVCSGTRDEHLILSRPGLLEVSRLGDAFVSEVLKVTPSPLTTGIAAPFTAYNTSIYSDLQTGQALMTITNDQIVAASRFLGQGLITLIGTDFLTNRTGMDRLLANVVSFKQQSGLVFVGVSPSESQYFVNGSWSGDLAVHRTGLGMRLTASDLFGVAGQSERFEVAARNDLSVVVNDSPDPLLAGQLLTYRARVANAGPGMASSVMMTNTLPEGLFFHEIVSSQGSCLHSNGSVFCDLGELPADQDVEIFITVEPVRSGLFTNIVEVVSSNEEEYLENNQTTVITLVNPPSLTAQKIQVVEGNDGTTEATMPITLFPAIKSEVRVDYATSDNTAIDEIDYLSRSGTLVFLPGETNQTVRIPILTDDLNEGFETFYVNLLNPVEGVVFDSQTLVVVEDDDPEPVLSVNDTQVVEGDDETSTNAVFHFTLSRPSGRSVEVSYLVDGESATLNKDFASSSGTLVFSPGSTNLSLLVQINGDDEPENDETFVLRLSAGDGIILPVDNPRGTILDNDEERLSHFTWNEIPSPQFLKQPFPVTITAEDILGQPVPGFSRVVRLSGFTNPEEILSGDSSGVWKYPLGAGFHDQRLQALYHADELGGPTRLTALSLQLAAVPGQRLNGWTIRLKHSDLTEFEQPVWDADDWQTVYQRNENIVENGWVTFSFFTPFLYNGQDQLMVDFTFDNSSFSTDGLVHYQETDGYRSLHFSTDSAFGSPLDWSGARTPPGELSARVPRIKFSSEVAVPVNPPAVSNFVDGVWTGNITVLETARSLQLRARVDEGQEGLADAFTVEAIDDLGLQVSFSPDPVTIDGLVTFTFQITNTGPSTSSGVVLTNFVSPSLVIQDATASQGSCTFPDGNLHCELGTMLGESDAVVQLTALSSSTGLITNIARITRSEPEDFILNNAVLSIARAQPPGVVIGDISVEEGDEGVSEAFFPVTLSNPTELLVTISYETVGGTATNLNDFMATNGVLAFPPGETNGSIPVLVYGDRRDEFEETFFMNLSNPTNALLIVESGMATITGSDPQPSISVFDLEVMEGDEGFRTAAFAVELSEISGKFITVKYSTRDGSAAAGEDYLPRTGTIVFPPGLTSWVVFSQVIGDLSNEPDETFFLTLTNPVNASLGMGEGTATILTDDGLPGVLEYFEWSPIDPWQISGQPFTALLTAKDFQDQTITNFFGFAELLGRTGAPDILVGDESRSTSSPLGTGYHEQRTQLIYLSDELGEVAEFVGVGLEVGLPPGQALNNLVLRMKHTNKDRFLSPEWDNDGWITLLQTNFYQPTAGRVSFVFQHPFSYNGNDHVMIDLSFDNSYFTINGYVAASVESGFRTQSAQADGEFGSPLDWAGNTAPRPILDRNRPVMKFLRGQDVPLSPNFANTFDQGVWSGEISIPLPVNQMLIEARDGNGKFGLSASFQVLPALDVDTDEDGMPDAWEWRYFGSLDAPDGDPSLDPDNDGALNLHEAKAGTNPLDPSSLFIITEISIEGQMVQIRLATVSGRLYQLERTSDLALGDWTVVAEGLIGDGDEIEVSDPITDPAVPLFYRVRLQE